MSLINGSPGPDLIIGTADNDTINGLGGDDHLLGLGGDDAVRGGEGDDELRGDNGADRLDGGPGNDRLSSFVDLQGVRDIVVDGGSGIDIGAFNLTFTDTGISFGVGDPSVSQDLGGTRVVGIERLDFTAGSGADSLTGGMFSDTLRGGFGIDTLDGGDGDDSLSGGRGADTLMGGGGNDSLNADSVDRLIDGGAGTDFVLINDSNSVAGVTISLAHPAIPQTFGHTTLVNVERIEFFGGSGDDTVTGGALDDVLLGGAGSDRLIGGAGSDILVAGMGDSLIDGGRDLDKAFFILSDSTLGATLSIAHPAVAQSFNGTTLVGVEQLVFNAGTGNDDVTGGALDDTILANDGDDRLAGGQGADLLAGANGNDSIFGGGGNDVLAGQAGNDLVQGREGDDFMTGGDGEDTLRGGAGFDRITGEFGDDHISGGLGKDMLEGGAGSDIFMFDDLESRPGGGARDLIVDFAQGSDKIDLSALGIDDISDLIFQKVGTGVVIFADLNGDGVDAFDFGLQLLGSVTLGAEDFIFA